MKTDNSNIVVQDLENKSYAYACELYMPLDNSTFEITEDAAWKNARENFKDGANWQKEQLQPLIDSHAELSATLGDIIEYTFAMESDFEKCLLHIRKLAQDASKKANKLIQ